ncbi:MAG: cyclic nucleotide-binding domain-containing protein [Spirochaetales bacterium]|nr:cyclic nucleotide-binding domain-containing protein [Spirochaetales bacterium]
MKDLDVNQYKKQIRELFIFKYLSEDEQGILARLSEIKGYEDKEKIVAEGDLQPYIFAVIRGSVHVMVDKGEGKKAYICTIGDGDVFGEAGIFLKVKRTADVISTGESVLLRINRENMLKFIKKHPAAGIKILILVIYSLLKKLRDANQEIAFERKTDIDQEDVDSLINEFML